MSGGVENACCQVRKWLSQSPGGTCFGDVLLPPGARLKRVYVHSADLVDGLQFEYVTEAGMRGLSRFAGGVGGYRQVFDLPEGEGLLAVSGSCGRFLSSLRFHTGGIDSREFGRAAGERFCFEFGPDFEFRGFFGREGIYLDALGLLLERRAGQALPSAALPEFRANVWKPSRRDALIPATAGVDRKAA